MERKGDGKLWRGKERGRMGRRKVGKGIEGMGEGREGRKGCGRKGVERETEREINKQLSIIVFHQQLHPPPIT